MKSKNLNYFLGLPYTIRIHKDEFEGYFAMVEELKGCMTQGETYQEAAANILDALKVWLQAAIENGNKIPEPEKTADFSGKFVLRIPRTLHRELAINAKKEKVSLNQYIIYMIAGANNKFLGKHNKNIHIEGK